MAHQSGVGFLTVGRNSIFIQVRAHRSNQHGVDRSLDITLICIYNIVGMPRIKTNRNTAILSTPDWKLSLVPVVIGNFHADDWLQLHVCQSTDALQTVFYFILLVIQLPRIRKMLELTAATLAGYGTERLHTVG